MAEDCGCSGGRCGSLASVELNRRDFLEKLAVGTAALAIVGQLAATVEAKEPAALTAPKSAGPRPYPLTPPRVYRGKHLEAVAMPLGGIGTGSLWLDGQGRLSVWQIFNNLSEPRIPDTFFAVRVRSGDDKPIVRVLQTAEERGLKPLASLSYEGGYPIARLTFNDPSLPVQMRLEALNPMIPLDAVNSSIPCALFRITATNPPGRPVANVDLLATLQNAVGSGGDGGVQGVRFGGYGQNRNRVVRDKTPAPSGGPGSGGMVAIAMDKSADPVATGPVKIRSAGGGEVEGPEIMWLAGVSGLTPDIAGPMARIAAEGGLLVADGATKNFAEAVAALRSQHRDFESVATVFEDFEKKTYEGWTITGTAFGKGPSHGTEAGQQPVTGFAGRGLVNTFGGGDGPQGTATSKKFTIERRYIGFLMGGGNHPGKTCMNLLVGGKAVRTAMGKGREALEPASWDVSEFKGKEAAIEIVDHSSEGWGHINVDQIIFSDIPPESLLVKGTTAESAAKALGISFTSAEEAKLAADTGLTIADDAPAALKVLAEKSKWAITNYTRLVGFHSGEHGCRALISTGAGDPLVIEGPLGKGRIILALAPRLPWSWGCELIAAARGEALKPGERLVPGNPAWGTMALAALDADGAALPAWSTAEELMAFLSDPASGKTVGDEATSKPGETINGALSIPLVLQPGESKSATFAITWHFPNVQRFQHAGNLYSRHWADATAVAKYVAKNLGPLWDRTRLYHDTVYQSNLPEEFLDAMMSQSVILRGPTCFWSEDGYFAGFEGSYGCCPLNCTHVWNYAQSHARLFPAVGQNMRISNFITYLHPSGETSHREHAVHGAFIDGHCACIEAAYREYQLSPDRKFLETVWPGVKKAVDWLIEAIDRERVGMPHGHQANTYDTSVSGANTFIGSQYLSALASGERMAQVMNDDASARRWRAVLDAGIKNQNEKLWNGEYYIQIPDPHPAEDYDTGCHADQLLGQWWAHMLNLGYLYPPARIKSALAAVKKYNFREKFAGFKQAPRRYIPDDDGGLIICTWPHGGRPNPFILYADEVWTGIEYAAAGAMIYEGLIDDARQVVRMARSRYDGRTRDGLNSGPGGNPYNELECGKFYARAMSSWSLLIACQGLVLDGPRGILGFKPAWQPEDHRSFFTAPEGWGLFVQRRKAGEQTERIEVHNGRLRLRELVFETPQGIRPTATVIVAGQPVALVVEQKGSEIRLELGQEVTVPEGAAVEVTLSWHA
jgi:uncharacterized protein (DUF608 family)